MSELSTPGMRWFVRGDLDGFFGLAIDNLVQLLVITALCQGLLGFSDELLFGRVLPGVAISLIIGNLFYAWQAKRLAAREGRSDVCALPYGINTPSMFAFILLVMLPAKIAAEAGGASPEDAAVVAWRVGLIACLGSGVIEFVGAFAAPWIRKVTPRAALLSTLAGIAIVFISGMFLFKTYAYPVVGLATLAVILLAYFGRVRIRGGVPAGLVAVAIGAGLAWATGIAGKQTLVDPGFYAPLPVWADMQALFTPGEAGELALGWKYLAAYLSVIIPMGLFNVIGSMQNIESAEAEGDRYATWSSLSVNGVGTMAAAAFGSCFPTTIYIGHPGWKAMGARAGYSVLNAVFITILCVTGTVAHVAWAVPIEAGMAIVLWIGIVITAQAFTATPREHAPAVVVGLLPAVVAFGALMAKFGLQVGGVGPPGERTFISESQNIIDGFAQLEWEITGAFALEQGFILTAMILAGATVMVIERKFVWAMTWCLVAALLTTFGLMHSYTFTPGDTAIELLYPKGDAAATLDGWWTWLKGITTMPWVLGYLCMAGVFLLAKFITVPDEQADHGEAFTEMEAGEAGPGGAAFAAAGAAASRDEAMAQSDVKLPDVDDSIELESASSLAPPDSDAAAPDAELKDDEVDLYEMSGHAPPRDADASESDSEVDARTGSDSAIPPAAEPEQADEEPAEDEEDADAAARALADADSTTEAPPSEPESDEQGDDDDEVAQSDVKLPDIDPDAFDDMDEDEIRHGGMMGFGADELPEPDSDDEEDTQPPMV